MTTKLDKKAIKARFARNLYLENWSESTHGIQIVKRFDALIDRLNKHCSKHFFGRMYTDWKHLNTIASKVADRTGFEFKPEPEPKDGYDYVGAIVIDDKGFRLHLSLHSSDPKEDRYSTYGWCYCCVTLTGRKDAFNSNKEMNKGEAVFLSKVDDLYFALMDELNACL